MASCNAWPDRKAQKISVVIKDYANKTKYKETFFSWTRISELKNFITKKNGFTKEKQKLFYKQNELTYPMTSIEDLLDKKNQREITQHLYTHDHGDATKDTLRVINAELEGICPDPLKKMIFKIKHGFEIGLNPSALEEGVSGNYFLKDDSRSPVAIFKPFDEEAFAPNNPKGYVGVLGSDKGFRPGILSGENATREVAAYLLDNNSVHNVPPTTFVQVAHPYFSGNKKNSMLGIKENSYLPKDIKLGSLQMLRKNDGEIGDFSCSKFRTDEVQAIAALDLRILNCDRNEGNILVRIKKTPGGTSYKLIPIDHGLSFPDNLSIADYEVVWYMWPQIRKPINEKLKEYIQNLDIKKNIKLLQNSLTFRPICLRNYRIAETLLKEAVKMDFNLWEISKIVYKEDRDEGLSILEEIVDQTEKYYKRVRDREFYSILTKHQNNELKKKGKFKGKDKSRTATKQSEIDQFDKPGNNWPNNQKQESNSNDHKLFDKKFFKDEPIYQQLETDVESPKERIKTSDLEMFNGPDSKVEENNIVDTELRMRGGRKRIWSENDRDQDNSPSRLMVDQALNKIKSMKHEGEEGFDLNVYLKNKDVYAKDMDNFLGPNLAVEEEIQSMKAPWPMLSSIYTITAEESQAYKDFPKVFLTNKEVISPWDSGRRKPDLVALGLSSLDSKNIVPDVQQDCLVNTPEKDVGNCQNTEDPETELSEKKDIDNQSTEQKLEGKGLKRTLSNPEFNFNKGSYKDKSLAHACSEEIDPKLSQKINHLQKKRGDQYNNELFFYFFEFFLNHHLKKELAKKTKSQGRNRFYSEVQHS